MAVRGFDGTDDRIRLNPGAITNSGAGPKTFAAIVKRTADSGTGSDPIIALNYAADIDGSFYFGQSANTLALLNNGATQTSVSSFTVTASDGWCLVAVTKASGTATPRFHKYRYSDATWTHSDGSAAIGNGAATTTLTIEVGSWFNGVDTAPIRLAVAGVWNSVLSDATIETLELALQAWVDANPGAFWCFDQASTATPVDDLSSTGTADQTAITGTSVVTGDDPPGFDFTLGGGSGTSSSPGLVRVVIGAGRWGMSQAVYNTAAIVDVAEPIIQTINQVTETDVSQSITRIKTRLVAQRSETNTAQPIARIKTRIIGQVAETDVPQIITAVRSRATGQATETDVSRPITTLPRVNRTTETDVAQAVTRIKTKLINQVIETDISTATTSRKTKTLAQAVATDVSQPVVERKTKAFGQATETDLATVTAKRKTKALAQAVETDIAQIIVRPGQVNRTIETDVAQAVTRVKTRVIGQALESNTANAVTERKSRLVAQTVETDISNSAAKGKLRILGQAQETELAQPIALPGKIRLVTETDIAQPITRIKRRIIGQVVETSTSQAVTKKKTRTLGQPTETDTARIVYTYIRVNKVTETDIAQPVIRIKRRSIGQATESNTVFSLSKTHTKTVNRVTETDTIFGLSRQKLRLLGRVIEVDIAQDISFGGIGSPLTMFAARPSYASVAGYHKGLVGYVLEHEYLAAAGELAEV